MKKFIFWCWINSVWPINFQTINSSDSLMKKIPLWFTSTFFNHFTKLTKIPKILSKKDKKSAKVLIFTPLMFLIKIVVRIRKRERLQKPFLTTLNNTFLKVAQLKCSIINRKKIYFALLVNAVLSAKIWKSNLKEWLKSMIFLID